MPSTNQQKTVSFSSTSAALILFHSLLVFLNLLRTLEDQQDFNYKLFLCSPTILHAELSLSLGQRSEQRRVSEHVGERRLTQHRRIAFCSVRRRDQRVPLRQRRHHVSLKMVPVKS